MSHILNCKKNISPENFFIFWYVLALWICIIYAKKNWGVMSWFFLLQSCEWSGTFYAFCANEYVYVRGNNREIPFVGVVSVIRTGLYPCQLIVCDQFGGGGGGGGTRVHRGAAPALCILRKKGSFFKTSACPRFCKRRLLFCTQVRSMGVKIPLKSTKYTRLWRQVTPEVTGLPSLLPTLGAA